MTKRGPGTIVTRELAGHHRKIWVLAFFLKNRYLPGVDSATKALLTTIQKAIDNALDACEDEYLPHKLDDRNGYLP